MSMSRTDIDHGRDFDWGRTSADYARFRDIYPQAFYEKLAELSLGVKGQRALDLGTGTGVIPRNMAPYGASWTGADVSENQIRFAEKLSREAGLEIAYAVASAEEAAFPDASFDVVTACQCFNYFDKARALPNIRRMLRDGGHFAILFMAWLKGESELAEKSEELVRRFNPAWTGGGIRPYELREPPWCAGLFRADHLLTYALPVRFTREGWHGRMKACRGIGAAGLTEDEIVAWETAHRAMLQGFPEEFDIPHFVTILDLEKA